MGKKLTSNLGLKIGSILFAGILWLLVTNINNPSTPVYFTDVPVQIINANLITSQGKIYEVLDDTDVIDSITIMVPRSLTDSMSSEDNIVAIADMNKLTNLNTIHIDVSTRRNQSSVSSIKTSNDILKLNIEDKKSISIPLTTTTSGSLQDEYIIGAVTPDQNLVRVSGPESVVSQIKTAEVNVNVTGFTSDIGTNAEIKLYDVDKDGNKVEVPKDKLTLNINNVGVKVEILATKSVPLRFSASGVPAAGYRATGAVSGSVESVSLAGKANILNNLSVIEIPDTEIDLTGATENVVKVVDIDRYLPGSVNFADSEFDGNVTVTAYVEREIVRTFTIAEEDITVENLPEGYEAKVSTYEEEFQIQVRGLAQDVNTIDAGQLHPSVDIESLIASGVMEEVQEGYYDVRLSLNLPEEVELRENVTVRLTIEEK